MEHLYQQFLKERQFLSGFSPRTIKLYRWTFNRWDALVGDFPTERTVKDFVIRLTESGVKPVTVNMYDRAFNPFLTWLAEEGHTAVRLRVSKVKQGQQQPKTYTEETLRRERVRCG